MDWNCTPAAESNIERLNRFPLGHFPTPLEELSRLSRHFGGPRLFIKRDDLTGLALGGNKTRKLEFLIADALAQNADTVITAGAAQSNHCRQTAAAAARAGLRCVLVLGGEKPDVPNGNLLLDHLFGADVEWTGPDRRGETMDEVAAGVTTKGGRPYLIPYGGSNAIGATGYVLAQLELRAQMPPDVRFDHIVFASSSGGTQAGLVVGAAVSGFRGQIIGVSVDKGDRGPDTYEQELEHLARETAAHVGVDRQFSRSDFVVNYKYLGGGYGVVGELEREAIRLLARHEGILLDPVYTGRAMGGLIDMILLNSFSPKENVLFWHTGGAPALFAYARKLGVPTE
jgi:D-cysteine desulfhydrase family pyridoxal phosphate-dependent enzyme